MDTKRRIALSAALLAVGIGSGHLVQSLSARDHARAKAVATVADGTVKESAVTELSGKAVEPAPAQKAIMPVVEARLTPEITLPTVAPEIVTPHAPKAEIVPVNARADAPVSADPQPVSPTVVTAAEDCSIQLDLSAQPSATIGLTLIAPCHPDERIVLRHAGLSVTGKTSASGVLFTTLPAMEVAADVTVRFAAGATETAMINIPEAAKMRRFGVQWLADDAFQLHAFENGADYDTPGHVFAGDSHAPKPGLTAEGGFLTQLGDSSVNMPMLAEIYTYPADAGTPVRIALEAAVTAKTCNHELLGETLIVNAGQVTVTDLNVAMPACDAVGDILVLKNLADDVKIATAN